MYLVFDIGGTNTRLATSSGQDLQKTIVIPTAENFSQALQDIKDAILQLTEGQQITAAAGGVRGSLDKDRNTIIRDHIHPDWVNKPLKQELEKILSAPLQLENDAAAAALGEAVNGAGKGYQIVAYLTISTGVGGAKIEDGQIDKNSLGFEPGQQIINHKTLEDLISGSALEKRYHQKPQEIKDPKIWEEVAENLAIGINNILITWSPEIVVIGGGVSKAIPLAKVELYLQQIVNLPKIPPIKRALLEDNSGLYGGLILLKSKHPVLFKGQFNFGHIKI